MSLIKHIQIRRGLQASLPTLLPGELAFSTDTRCLWIGTITGNYLISCGGSPSGITGTLAASFVATIMAFGNGETGYWYCMRDDAAWYCMEQV